MNGNGGLRGSARKQFRRKLQYQNTDHVFAFCHNTNKNYYYVNVKKISNILYLT